MVKRFLVASLLALAAALVPAARASDPLLEKSYALPDAVKLALKNSADVLAAEQDITLSQERLTEARLRFLPEVGLQASATKYEARYPFALAPELRSVLLFPAERQNFYSGRAYMMQTLYAGRRNVNTFRLAQSALKQAQSRYDAAKMQAAVETKRVFYQLLLAQERLAAVTTRLQAALDVPARGSAWDKVEAEAALAALRARKSEAEHAVELARLEFRKVLNLELDTPIRVEGKLESRAVDVDLRTATVWAMELRPELQVETYKAQMDDIAVNLAMGRRIPSVLLMGDYELTDQTFPVRNNNWQATIGVRLPLSFDYYVQIRQKRAEQRQGEIKRAESQDRVRLEVRQSHENVLFWQGEWPRREKDLERLKSLADAAASEGRGLAAVRVQTALLEAQDRWLVAVTEHLLARSRLERAVGRGLE